MNEQQTKWLNEKIKFMQDQIEKNWPLSDSQWSVIADTIEKIITQSKNNVEVRKALHDFIEVYDRKARIKQ